MKRATGNDDTESRTAAAYLPTTPDGGDRLILRGATLIDGGVLVKDSDAWFPDPPKRALTSH